jgi:NAD(P)-dependent dehydrogenase (short-subunit alcohol dehydrogenase family)
MSDFFNLKGQVAVVTGGGSGIGLKTVERFIAAGARVVMADRDDCSEKASALGASFAGCDVSKESDVEQLLEATLREYGRLDILVNNAGVFGAYQKLDETTTDVFDRCYRVNLLGVAHGIKHAAKRMQPGGRIVNTASAAGLTGAVSLGAYVASKHAVVGLSKTAAVELGAQGIRVNCVCPTTVNTPMAHEQGGDFMIAGERLLVPLGRICEAEEVAAAIHFLASEECGFVNGQALLLDGGMGCGMTEIGFSELIS